MGVTAKPSMRLRHAILITSAKRSTNFYRKFFLAYTSYVFGVLVLVVYAPHTDIPKLVNLGVFVAYATFWVIFMAYRSSPTENLIARTVQSAAIVVTSNPQGHWRIAEALDRAASQGCRALPPSPFRCMWPGKGRMRTYRHHASSVKAHLDEELGRFDQDPEGTTRRVTEALLTIAEQRTAGRRGNLLPGVDLPAPESRRFVEAVKTISVIVVIFGATFAVHTWTELPAPFAALVPPVALLIISAIRNGPKGSEKTLDRLAQRYLG